MGEVKLSILIPGRQDGFAPFSGPGRSVFENTGTATVLSEQDTTLSMVNRGFAALMGYTREAIEGRMKWTELVDPADHERMLKIHYLRRRDPAAAPTSFERYQKPKIDRCLGEEELRFKAWYDTPGMGRRYIDTFYYPSRDDDGTISGVVIVGRDITDLRKLEGQLLHAQKMEAVGTRSVSISRASRPMSRVPWT